MFWRKKKLKVLEKEIRDLRNERDSLIRQKEIIEDRNKNISDLCNERGNVIFNFLEKAITSNGTGFVRVEGKLRFAKVTDVQHTFGHDHEFIEIQCKVE